MKGWRRRGRLAVLLVLAPLPTVLKRLFLRTLFGYRIARGSSIGLSVIDVQRCVLGEGSRIGHFNLITRVDDFRLGRHARIGVLNVIRGGDKVTIGDYATLMRLNFLNAIPDHDCTTNPTSVLEIGAGSVLVAGHRVDFTDRVSIGRNVVVGGRRS